MTPNTTPMTHEEALAAIDSMVTITLERGWHTDHKAMKRLRAYIEAERTRAEALAAILADQQRTIEALTMGVENLEGTTPILTHMARQDARIAELEAKVGRCEALAAEWREDDMRHMAVFGQHHPASLVTLANLLRTALRGQDTALMGKEG